jgi:tetratricopeptide (TPR) repeat protein
VGLTLAYLGRITYGPMAPRDAYPRIIEYAEKAMELDPSLAEVYTMQGVINTLYHWNWTEAEKNFKRSLELNPNISATHIFYSYLLNVNRRFAEGISETQRAVELDPISGYSHSAMGQAYYFSRQFKRAIREFKKAIALNPGNFQAHLFLGLSYIPQKRIIKAYYQFKKAIRTSDGLPMAVSAFAAVNYKTGRKKVARKLLESLIERSSYEYIPALIFFTIYNCMGEHDKAFKWFKKAFNERESMVPWIRINPLGFINRLDEPRYKELLDRIGLAP